MRREFSAGGVVVRRMRAAWWFAAIQPQGSSRGKWTLPKGLVDGDETMRDAAVREVFEETGLQTVIVEKLGDSRYTYTWDGERIFKVVSFFLLRPVAGRIGVIAPEMTIEVAQVRWLPLADPSVLAYRGEREVAELARERVRLSSHPSR